MQILRSLNWLKQDLAAAEADGQPNWALGAQKLSRDENEFFLWFGD